MIGGKGKRKSEMNIAIDFDGVCADFVSRFLQYTNLRYGHDDHPNQLEFWDWWDSEKIILSREEWLEAFEEFSCYRMWQSIPVLDGAVDSLCTRYACLGIQRILP